jgi:LysR family glycine cleavage system transcriptional activator
MAMTSFSLKVCMAKLPHVTWLRSFEVAARHGSFSAAAEELGMTPAAVSQQIRLLEQMVGKALFIRLPRGVVLSDAGKAYAQPIRRSFAEMQAATNGLFGPSTKRTIRVRASISFAGLVIAPRIADFYAMHPDILVELTSFVWAEQFGEEPSDIDIRYGTGDWKDGTILHLGHEHAIPVCHPDYAATLPQPLTLQALAADRRINIMGSEADWEQLSDQYGLNLKSAGNWFTVDSSFIALQSVIARAGSAIVLERFAHHYLQQGMIVAPFDYRLPISLSHFIVCSERSIPREEVKLFCDWLMASNT